MRANPPPAGDIDPRSASGPALRTFFRIARCWDLDDEEQMAVLGGVPPTAFSGWKRSSDAVLPMETLERISYILGIFKALNILLPDEESADGWVRKPNDASLFGGKPALYRFLSGRMEDLRLVRQYLDAQRGGWS